MSLQKIKSELKELEKNIKIKFKDKSLLVQSMIHRSYLNENPDFVLDQNERLEFLGDAVLELIVTEYLFKNYDNPEGELTNWRAALVNSSMLAECASEIDLNRYLLLSKGESRDKGRARQYILANTIEALIGAIYLDRGYNVASKFIKENILIKLPRILREKTYKDAKSLFQEEAQERVGITPHYEVLQETGPDHDKKFIVGVYLNKELVAEGEGPSKQSAQQKAAEEALHIKGWRPF